MRSLFLATLLSLLLLIALRYPFAGALAFGWISFMNPHQQVWGFASGIPWAFISIPILLVGCLIAREPKRLPVNAVTLCIVLFMAHITLSTVVAQTPSEETWDLWLRTIKIFFSVLVIAALLTDRWRIHAIVWLMAICIGFYGVKGGLFTLMTGGGNIVLGPGGTMIADRNHLAVALLVVLPLMNYLRLHSAHALVRIGLAAAMALSLVAAIGSNSRGALVSTLAAGAVMWYRSRSKVASAIVMVFAGIAIVSFMPASWKERMTTIENYEGDTSAMGRVTIWRAAFQIGLHNPLTGAGFRAPYHQYIVNQFTPDIQARATHSIWFEPMAEHGLLGFAIWLGGVLAGIYYALRIPSLARGHLNLRWAYDLARMSQVSIVAFLTGASFLSLPYWDLFWLLLATLAATHYLVRQEVGQPIRAAAPAFGRQPAFGGLSPGHARHSA
jgi:probable O-glycosylation ligase (exosortase A-associated)